MPGTGRLAPTSFASYQSVITCLSLALQPHSKIVALRVRHSARCVCRSAHSTCVILWDARCPLHPLTTGQYQGFWGLSCRPLLSLRPLPLSPAPPRCSPLPFSVHPLHTDPCRPLRAATCKPVSVAEAPLLRPLTTSTGDLAAI